MIIYVDGIFDLFHRGHLESFKYIKTKYPNCKLYVGVISDNDAKSYKRSPIIYEEDRTEIIRGIKYVDKVIFPAPFTLFDRYYTTTQFTISTCSKNNMKV